MCPGAVGRATPAAHSASNGSDALFSDFVRVCSGGARRGDGDVLLTTCPNHCSGFGSCVGLLSTMAVGFCGGDVGDCTDCMIADAGDVTRWRGDI